MWPNRNNSQQNTLLDQNAFLKFPDVQHNGIETGNRKQIS